MTIDTAAILQRFHAHFNVLALHVNNEQSVTVNENGLVDVVGHVGLKRAGSHITAFPVSFGTVMGDFRIDSAPNLTSLRGAPYTVDSITISKAPQLVSLEGGPTAVGGDYTVMNCAGLRQLTGIPDKIAGHLIIMNTPKLQSLQNGPTSVIGTCHIEACTSLTTLEGAPASCRIFNCTKLTKLKTLAGIGTFNLLSLSECTRLETLAHIPAPIIEHPVIECRDCPKLLFAVNHSFVITLHGGVGYQPAEIIRGLMLTKSYIDSKTPGNYPYVDVLKTLYKTGDLLAAITWFETYYNKPFTPVVAPPPPVVLPDNLALTLER